MFGKRRRRWVRSARHTVRALLEWRDVTRIKLRRSVRRYRRRWWREPDRLFESKAWRRWWLRRALFGGLVALVVAVAVVVWPTKHRLIQRYQARFSSAVENQDWETARLCAGRLLELDPQSSEYRYWDLRGRASRVGPESVVRSMRQLVAEKSDSNEAIRWLALAETARPSLMRQGLDDEVEGERRWREQVVNAFAHYPRSRRLASLSAISLAVESEGRRSALAACEELALDDERHWLHVAVLAARDGQTDRMRQAVVSRLGSLEAELSFSGSSSSRRKLTERMICWMLLGDFDHVERLLRQDGPRLGMEQVSQLEATLASLRAEQELGATNGPAPPAVGGWLRDAWAARAERQSLVRLTEQWLARSEPETSSQFADVVAEPESEFRKCARLLLEGLLAWEVGSLGLAESHWRTLSQSEYGIALLNNYAWWTLSSSTLQARAHRMLDLALESPVTRENSRLEATLLETRGRLYLAQGWESQALDDAQRSRRLRDVAESQHR
ncbi:MAG: hypothetical protein KDA83_09910 [Planctomycetales bacterium]|nr:hypothetical protein [Planctomycetales bacterium]